MKASRKYRQENKKKDQKSRARKKDIQKDRNPLREYAKYSSIGFQMLVIILLSVYGGIKLDEWVKSLEFPLFSLLGAIIGVALGIYYAIKDFIKF